MKAEKLLKRPDILRIMDIRHFPVGIFLVGVLNIKEAINDSFNIMILSRVYINFNM